MYKNKISKGFIFFLLIIGIGLGTLYYKNINIENEVEKYKVELTNKNIDKKEIPVTNKNEIGNTNMKNIDNGNIKDLQNDIFNIVNSSAKSVVYIDIQKEFKNSETFAENFKKMFGVEVELNEEYIDKNVDGSITQKVGGGSGIIASKNGYIITNKHVVMLEDASYIVYDNNGKKYQVDSIWRDPVIDIAILKIKNMDGTDINDLEPATFRNNLPTRVGQITFAIGYSLGEYDNSLTMGIVSGVGRRIYGIYNDAIYIGLIQIDTALNPGNSGGPLIDIDGKVIGINTAVAGGENVGFSIPINKEIVEKTLSSIQTGGNIKRPFLGIGFIDLDNKTSDLYKDVQTDYIKGTYVTQVEKGSIAEKVGLETGDVIISIDGQELNLENTLIYSLYKYIPGDTITIVYFDKSNNKKEKIDVALAERPLVEKTIAE